MIKIKIKDRAILEHWFLTEVSKMMSTKTIKLWWDNKRNKSKKITPQILLGAYKLYAIFFGQFNRNNVILCSPNLLDKIIINKDAAGYSLFKEYSKYLYKEFIDLYGYNLANYLNVSVCPYCNRQYVFTVTRKTKDKGVRPQFDHFYPKSTYPQLALSLYNLVPCCATCNSAKRDNKILSVNPYIKGFEANCRFEIDKIEKCILGDSKKEWTISLPRKGNHIGNANAFVLNELFNEHKDYIEEVVFKAKVYNSDIYNDLCEVFPLSHLSEAEVEVLVFGNYTLQIDYDKRPLSKLTADVIYQLKSYK